ncbi:hypothetical protein DSO57_1015726 [Entomophthora muscae]|uniref:Uncharacterized protein n=1 Tax=Entomophthora muscae TaxID=34485 RepID=A0ACC2RWE9_9FUNG|nr:hypothetical protein DSO57_1015726 [Entomophthora muscae]
MSKIKLIVALGLAVSAERPDAIISRLAALIYDGTELACMGFIRDSNSLIAPASCLASIKKASFRQAINNSQSEKINHILPDTRRTSTRHFTFNKALASTSTIKGAIAELESLYPGGGNINPEVVSVDKSLELQVHHFTLADYSTCSSLMYTQGYSAKRFPDDIFCAESNTSTPDIVVGAPAFLPPLKPTDDYFVAGIYVGSLCHNGHNYYFFTSVFDLVKHWQ